MVGVSPGVSTFTTNTRGGMIVAARVILGIGVGLEGGTVPVYVAETIERRIRGNIVSL